jgi:hypothetical protein
MNRADFQQLADVRIEEARILLSQGKPDGAYYLAGYAVECALKACICKRTNQYDYPDKQLALKCYTHDLKALVSVADLMAQLLLDRAADPLLDANWRVVEVWDESTRYARKTLVEAQRLYDAITDAAHGILPWVKLRW